MIHITEHAASQLASLLKSKEAPEGSGLRLLVSRGGCAGMSYGMKIDTPTDQDTLVRAGGVTVFVDPESAPFLNGSTVDYVDDLSDSGFKVLNPNASRSCGCGSSFEPAEAESGEALPPAPEPSEDAFACSGDDAEKQQEDAGAKPTSTSGNLA